MGDNKEIELLEQVNLAQRLELALVRGGIPEVMRVVAETIQQQKAIIQQQQRVIEQLEDDMDKLAPMEVIRHFHVEITPEQHQQMLAQGAIPRGEDRICTVGYRVAVRTGKGGDTLKIYQDSGQYIGSLESFEKALAYQISPLIHTVPMKAELRRAGLPPIPEETIASAVGELAQFYLDPDYQHTWKNRADEVFERLIYPAIIKGGYRTQYPHALAKKRFKQAAELTLQEMERQRRAP